MTTAAQGVQKALARAGSSVVAIAEMTAADLIAAMNDDQKAELAASLAPAANAEMPPKKKEGCSEDGDEDDKEGDSDPGMKDKPKCSDEGTAKAADPRVKAVATAVATDDACKGKADLALSMLADDDFASLSASGIVKLLGKSPATAQVATADPEAAARAEMKAALSNSKNSDIDPNGGASGSKAKASPWDRVIAEMNPNKAG